MTCDRARGFFGACWDDELTQAEREWLEAHFASCASCRVEYDEFSRVLELAGALPRVDAPADLPEQVLARVHRVSPAPDLVGQAGVRWMPIAAAAAAAVLVVGALVVMPRAPWRAPGSVEPARVASRPAAPAPPLPALRAQTEARQPLVAVRLPERRGAEPAPGAVIPDSLFDHGEDVEFILDPVTLRRGRASVTRSGSRDPGVQGQQALINF
jgi:anti-sigma factor RsiW